MCPLRRAVHRPTSRFCGATCRKASFRKAGTGTPEPAGQSVRRPDPARVVKTPAGPDFEVGAGLAAVVRQYLDGAPDGPTRAQAELLAAKLEAEQSASGAAALSRRLAELLDQLVLPEPPKPSAREELALAGMTELLRVHGSLDLAYLGKVKGGLDVWDAHQGCCWDASWARQWPSGHQPAWLVPAQPREELRDVAQRLVDDGLRPVPAGFAA